MFPIFPKVFHRVFYTISPGGARSPMSRKDWARLLDKWLGSSPNRAKIKSHSGFF